MQQETEDWVENARMLTDSARAIVVSDGTFERVRRARFQAPGFSPNVWSSIADMGWLGIRTREDIGGLALGLRETVALSGLLGRGLVPEPFIAVIFALNLLQRAGLKAEMGAVLTGSKIVVPAWQARRDSMDLMGGIEVREGRLRGAKIAVCCGVGADAFAVITPEGLALVPRDAAGLTITPVTMHDGTFQATLSFENVACDIHSIDAPQDSLFEAMLLHAGYLLGVAEQAFEITLDYLRVRKQFEAPIGSFQALQHRATEIQVQRELARAAIGAAAASIDLGQPSERSCMAVLRARSRAGGLARLVAREAVQMHGAIGNTDEADIGLFVRKAMVEAGQFAPEFRLREQFMALRKAAA
ncbi:MAG: acyl-CoA dehydrogenase family protein [Paracoccaceae bacterium]